jgi:peptidoglycan hydrolase CwlO-like protein
MPRHEMFGGMDPYDLLISMQDRMQVLENAHNSLANAYQKINNDVSVLLASVQTLQRGHLNHSEQLRNIGLVLENLNSNIELWREELRNKP